MFVTVAVQKEIISALGRVVLGFGLLFFFFIP